jgi:hypothetical protein
MMESIPIFRITHKFNVTFSLYLTFGVKYLIYSTSTLHRSPTSRNDHAILVYHVGQVDDSFSPVNHFDAGRLTLLKRKKDTLVSFYSI